MARAELPVHRSVVHRVAARPDRRARRRPRGAARRDPGRAAGRARSSPSSRQRVLGTDDCWTVSFACRALPFVRIGAGRPVAAHEAVAGRALARAAARRAGERDPRRAAVPRGLRPGVARRHRAVHRLQVPPDRPGARRTANVRGRAGPHALRHAARTARRADAPAPVRFLPAFDSIILAHRDRTRILPPEYVETVINKKNATTKNTFTVDGFVAGAWRIEKREARRSSRSRRCRCVRGARSRPRASGCSRSTRARARRASARARARRAAPRGRPRRTRSRGSRRARPPAA